VVAQLMPLAMVCPGEEVKIVGLRAGRGLAQRLADMGLVPGQTIRVISSHMPGPLMIGLHGSRLVLGYGVAQKIMVERRENA
jgi:ferrous iron transport protein A